MVILVQRYSPSKCFLFSSPCLLLPLGHLKLGDLSLQLQLVQTFVPGHPKHQGHFPINEKKDRSVTEKLLNRLLEK